MQNLIMRSLRQLPKIIAVLVKGREVHGRFAWNRIGNQMLRKLKCKARLADTSRAFKKQRVVQSSCLV